MEWDIVKILQWDHFKTYHFYVFFDEAVQHSCPGYERTSALTSAHGTIAPYSILMSDPGYSWAHMSANGSSWLVMSAELFYQTINKIWWVSEWPHCSILTISHSTFYQIMKIWIFLKSTRDGLLKNVQYGICRPLGSREIQQKKVGTVLVDTL